MSVESDNDRLAMLSDFGVDAEIGGKVITVIFDDEWIDANGVSSQAPVATARKSDVDGFVKDEKIYLNKTNYTFAESPHDDGQGMVHIVLQKT